MRLLFLVLGAWAVWRIAEENGMLERKQALLPAPIKPQSPAKLP